MTKANRKPFHHGNLREALLEAAFSLLDEGGADQITVRAVARKTGVSHAAPFNHFPDRQSLLTAVATLLYGELHAAIGKALTKKAASSKDRIIAFADAVVRYGIQHPNRYRLLWRQDLFDAGNEDLKGSADAIYALLTEELSHAYSGSQFDVDTFAMGLWSMCHGYVSLRLDGNVIEAKDGITGQPRHRAMIDAFVTPYLD